MKILTLLTAFALLVTSSTGFETDRSVTLAFHPKKNATYDEVIHIHQDISANVPGMGAQKSKNQISVYADTKCNGQNSDGHSLIAQTITRMTMDINAGGMSMNADTDDKGEGSAASAQIYEQLKDIIGGESVSTVDRKGNVVSVEMEEALRQKIEQFGGSIVDNNYSALPDKSVKIGDTWKQSKETKTQGMIMMADVTYELAAVKGNVAELKMSGSITSKPDPSAEAAAQGQIKSATVTGMAKVDIPSGMFMETVADFKMKMEVSAMGMSMETDVDQTLTRKVTVK
jgi:hypothetical protein